MDLYFQVGVLLLGAIIFSMVAFAVTSMIEYGNQAEEVLDKPTENYSMDSTITSSLFYVDPRVFPQWAISVKNQRDLYLINHNSIVMDEKIYSVYTVPVTMNISSKDQADRKFTVDLKTSKVGNNAFYVHDNSSLTVQYMTEFKRAAELHATDKMISVYTFIDNSTGKVAYVAQIK